MLKAHIIRLKKESTSKVLPTIVEDTSKYDISERKENKKEIKETKGKKEKIYIDSSSDEEEYHEYKPKIKNNTSKVKINIPRKNNKKTKKNEIDTDDE